MIYKENDVFNLHNGTAKWLKAPNGQPSKLNEKQWLQVRTSHFKNWFGDWEYDAKNASKALDSNGEPLIVYHGTPPDRYEFSEFLLYNEGIFFAECKYVARRYASNYCEDEFGPIKEVFLNIKNPKFIKSVQYKFDGYSGADANLKKQAERLKKLHPEFINTPYRYKEMIRERLENQKYDGLILEDHSWGTGIDYCKQFAAFRPDQIKSATANAGTFITEPNIYI